MLLLLMGSKLHRLIRVVRNICHIRCTNDSFPVCEPWWSEVVFEIYNAILVMESFENYYCSKQTTDVPYKIVLGRTAEVKFIFYF